MNFNENKHLDTPILKSLKNRILRLEDIPTVHSNNLSSSKKN
jgi:hypothetical protein